MVKSIKIRQVTDKSRNDGQQIKSKRNRLTTDKSTSARCSVEDSERRNEDDFDDEMRQMSGSIVTAPIEIPLKLHQ